MAGHPQLPVDMVACLANHVTCKIWLLHACSSREQRAVENPDESDAWMLLPKGLQVGRGATSLIFEAFGSSKALCISRRSNFKVS